MQHRAGFFGTRRSIEKIRCNLKIESGENGTSQGLEKEVQNSRFFENEIELKNSEVVSYDQRNSLSACHVSN